MESSCERPCVSPHRVIITERRWMKTVVLICTLLEDPPPSARRRECEDDNSCRQQWALDRLSTESLRNLRDIPVCVVCNVFFLLP